MLSIYDLSSFLPILVQLLKSADLGHHSLLYLKEIGHDWFGKVRFLKQTSFYNEGLTMQGSSSCMQSWHRV